MEDTHEKNKVGYMNDEQTIGEISGDVLEFIMKKTKKKNSEFVHEVMEILTLCLSELIKASHCSNHWKSAVDKAVNLIQNDFHEEKINE